MSAWRRCKPCPHPSEGLGQQPGHLLQKLLGWQGASWLPSCCAHSVSPSLLRHVFSQAALTASPSVLFPVGFPGSQFQE